MIQISYDRDAAVQYASQWAFKRNPAYFDFHGIGGDCTNFISQCLYAGCGVMNYTKTFGWYYASTNNRSPSWTGVRYLYQFLIENQSVGPYALAVDPYQILPGDVIQLGNSVGDFYHSLLAVEVGHTPTPHNILIATHSDDAYRRPLDTYSYDRIRYIHILGARKWQ